MVAVAEVRALVSLDASLLISPFSYCSDGLGGFLVQLGSVLGGGDVASLACELEGRQRRSSTSEPD